MSTDTSAPVSSRPQPDPDLVERLVAQLEHVLDEREYAEMLADTIMLPVRSVADASHQAAFRHPRLVNRSYRAASLLVKQANAHVKAASGEDVSTKEKRRNTEIYKALVGQERQLLRAILAGEKAKAGIVDNSPNPRERTRERIYQLLLAGHTITPQRAREILDEEEEKVAADRRARRKAARNARPSDGQRPVPARARR